MKRYFAIVLLYLLILPFMPLLDNSISLYIEPHMPLRKVVDKLIPNESSMTKECMIRLGQLVGVDKKIKHGEYDLQQRLSVFEILYLLEKGSLKQYAVTLKPGQTLSDWLMLLNKYPFLSDRPIHLSDVLEHFQMNDQSQIEGRFIPDTYHFPRNTTVLECLDRAHLAYQEWWAKHGAGDEAEILTVASIIEMETPIDAEKPLVASVIYNRLFKNMPLQMDSTVIYGLGESSGYLLSRKDLNTDNRYNTYRVRGLPPGPIAASSVSSLNAAINPRDTDWLYFVATGDGGHTFSQNYNDHVNAVNEYRKRMQDDRKANRAGGD